MKMNSYLKCEFCGFEQIAFYYESHLDKKEFLICSMCRNLNKVKKETDIMENKEIKEIEKNRETKKALPEIMKDIFEFENLIKNTFVLVVNYENELFDRAVNKQQNIDILDLDFQDLQKEVLLLHNKVRDKIKNNYEIFEKDNKELK